MHEGIVRMQSPGVLVPRADEVFEEDLSFSERAAVARRLAKIQVRVRSFFERFLTTWRTRNRTCQYHRPALAMEGS